MTEQEQLEKVKNNPLAIADIENPSEKTKIAAVTESGEAIKYIKNPSEELIVLALQRNDGFIPYVFNGIKDPTTKIQCEAFISIIKQEEFGYFIDMKKGLFFYLGTFQERNFFLSLPAYRSELEDTRYFESLLNFIMECREQWTEKFLKKLEPLTKEQQDIWNKHRLKTLL